MYQKGIYSSHVRNNFAQEVESEELRDAIAIPDNNAFVTLWITSMLLEAAAINEGPVPSSEQLLIALDALGSYHDKNSPAGDGTMVFWPQVYNSSAKYWYCSPVNMAWMGRDAIDMYAFIHKMLDDIHLEEVWKKVFERGYLIM